MDDAKETVLMNIWERISKRLFSKPKCPFSEEDSPFNLWKMKEQLKCKKCGKTWTVAFKRFDYMLQKITDKRAKHKMKDKDCDGEVEVSGIWYKYRDESPAEKKWREYERRFR